MRRLLPYSILCLLVYQVHAFRLPDQKLYHYQCKNCTTLSQKTLSTSWLIEDKAMEPAEVKPVKSKRYYRKVSGQELKEGIELGIVGENAVVRVTPINPRQFKARWQQKFMIETIKEKKPLADMVQSITDEQDIKQHFTVGPALIFQLKQGLSGQQPRLVYDDDNLEDTSQWQLSVYDSQSNLYLSVALDKNYYQIGESVKGVIEVTNDYSLPDVNWVEARVMGPSGEGMSVNLVEDGVYRFHGEVPVTSKQVSPGENWYFMVMADLTVNGSHTLRTAQAVFSYAVPSAKIRTVYRPSSDQPLSLKAGIETIQASRYKLQAVVYATGDDGELHSVALAQTSAWLEPGVTEMPIQIDKPLPTGMHPPYYLGQLELVDAAQLKPVHRYTEKIPFTKLDA